MAFKISPFYRVKKKARTKNAQTILDRLSNYLEENSDEPAQILCSFWEDQRNAVTYKELREAVQQGQFNQKQFEEWQQDYSILVANKLTSVWEKAMAAGPSGQPLFDALSFSVDMQNPGIVNWIKERGAEFVTSCAAEQKRAIQSLLSKKIIEEHTVDELARFIRPCIGLTDADAKAAMRLYDSVKKTLKEQHPRMKPENIQKKALDRAQKYAEKKHRQRAFTIAQTELEFAYNRGADQGVRQAQEAGLLGQTMKRWITSGDDAVCAVCAALDGTEIEMDETFDYKGRVLFPGHKMLPPAHPRCACAVEYIEVSAPQFTPEVIQNEEEEFREFENGPEAEKYFAGERPDRSLRRTNREEYDRLREEWENTVYHKWNYDLTRDESSAIMNYTGDDYSAINGLLRHEMTKNDVVNNG